MIKFLSDMFNNPYFVILSGVITVISLLGVVYIVYLIIKGIFPVLYRLGLGLSNRKIAIFADQEYNSLKDIFVDSKIFKDKNIIQINSNSIKKGEEISIMLVHWKCCQNCIDDILDIKKDSDALIVYAPRHEGLIDNDNLEKINNQRNSIIVNFRGRLLNDILVSMITTIYSKKG